MKRMISIIVLGLLLIALSACSTNPYKVRKGQDGYYISLPETMKNPNQFVCGAAPSVIFQDLSEMKDDILTGNFNEWEMCQLARFQRDASGCIQITDLENLYEPVLPPDLACDSITWYGITYVFQLADESGPIRSCVFVSPLYAFEEDIKRCEDAAKVTGPHGENLEVYETEDRNATVYRWESSDVKFDSSDPHKWETVTWYHQAIFYTFVSGNTTYYVQEYYRPDVSETVPSRVYLYGRNNNTDFYVYFLDLTERPNVEWLSEFGLTEYKG